MPAADPCRHLRFFTGLALLALGCASPDPVDTSWHAAVGYRWRALALRRNGHAGFTQLTSATTGLVHRNDVDDERESASYHLMDQLKARGAEVAYHDPHVPAIRPTREHAHWTGTQSVAWDRATVGAFDAVVIATAHKAVNYGELGAWAQCIIDTRNAMVTVSVPPGLVWKA